MKFSAVVLSVALAASQTSAFMAPAPMARSVGPRFSSEMAEETSAPTVATTTAEEDAPADMKNFEEKVAEQTAAEVAAAAAAVEAAPAPVTPATYELKTIDKSKIVPGRYADEEFSATLPFLKRPPKLDGTAAGDFGFDPLGFTEDYDLFTMQEAEIRHARLAMLAVVGWPLSELVAPSWMLQNGCAPSVLNGFNIPSFLAVVSIFGAFGFLEYKTALRRTDNTKFGLMHRADLADCEDGQYGAAGDYNFDPLNLYSSIGDDAYARKGLREVEISHGRAAMLGITAFAAWEAITGHPIVENSMFFHPNLELPALVAAYYAFGSFYELDEESADTFYKFKMSSEGQARWENLKMGMGMNKGPEEDSTPAGPSKLDDFSEKASGLIEGAQKAYTKLEKMYLENVVKPE